MDKKGISGLAIFGIFVVIILLMIFGRFIFMGIFFDATYHSNPQYKEGVDAIASMNDDPIKFAKEQRRINGLNDTLIGEQQSCGPNCTIIQ